VSSGVEAAAKGVKSAALMRRFCKAVREADARIAECDESRRTRMLNYHQPDARGHFGPYGGTFVAETLIHALHELRSRLRASTAATPSSSPSSSTNWRTLSAGPARSTTPRA
jgi:hypothetical protein